MRNFLVLCLAGMFAAGCDYMAPLVAEPELAIDDDVIGVWQRAAGTETERLLVLPLSPKEYLAVYPAGSADAMFARGCRWRSGEINLVQLNWLGTASGRLPQDTRTFQYVSYTLRDNEMRLRLLNPEVVAKDIATPEDLSAAIAANHDHPELFLNEMLFRKIPD